MLPGVDIPDLYGNDLRPEMLGVTAETCKAACDVLPLCAVFVYSATLLRCSLKQVVGYPRVAQGLTVYVARPGGWVG